MAKRSEHASRRITHTPSKPAPSGFIHFDLKSNLKSLELDKVRGSQYKVSGGNRGGDTPGPMPNPAVKPSIADGTAKGIRGRVGRRRN